MKKIQLLEFMDQADDKYVAESKIIQSKPRAGSLRRFSNFFKGIVSVAAILVIILGVFIWTLVGKDVLKSNDGKEKPTDLITRENARKCFEDGYKSFIESDYFIIDYTFTNQGNLVGQAFDTGAHSILKYADNDGKPSYLFVGSSKGETGEYAEYVSKYYVENTEYTQSNGDLNTVEEKEYNDDLERNRALDNLPLEDYVTDVFDAIWDLDYTVKKIDGNYVVCYESDDPEFWENIYDTDNFPEDEKADAYGCIKCIFDSNGNLLQISNEFQIVGFYDQTSASMAYNFQKLEELELDPPEWVENYRSLIKKLDPADYVKVEFRGNSGSGVATVTSLFPEEIKELVNISLNKTEELSNKDVVQISLDYDAEALAELGYSLSENTFVVTVSGLDESMLEIIDLFAYLDIRFDGTDGHGIVSIYKFNEPSSISPYFNFYIDGETSGLSNEDKVTVSVQYDLKRLEKLGYKVEKTQQTYRVRGLWVDPQAHEANDNKNPTVAPPSNGIITTAEELHAVLVNGDPTKDYKVTAKELDMTDKAWIGMENYSATFDFGGCVIKNASYPLFKSVKGGTVKNLVISDSAHYYTNDEARNDINPKTGQTYNLYYSPVVCYAYNITVENVTIKESVNVKADFWTNDACLGGIVALAEGTEIVIKDCSFYGSISTDSLKICIAAIAGKITSDDASTFNAVNFESSSVLVYRCVNYGSVIDIAYGNDSEVAGVVGYIKYGAVIKCANYGTVESTDGGRTAGILGQIYNSVAVIDCINSGSVIGGTKYAGGIVGYTRRGVSSVKCYIQGCINLGTISGNDLQYKGGIFGVIFYMDADIVNCYSLKSTNEVFGNYRNSGNKISAVIDFGENYKDELLTIRDSKNLDSIEKIFAEIEKVSPGVFKYENGTISFK